MKKNQHFIILVTGTILFLLLIFLLIKSPAIPAQFTGAGMDIKIYERISEVLMGAIWNGNILSVAVKIFSGYFAFIILVFGHYYFSRTRVVS
jgi:hypothetical protein